MHEVVTHKLEDENPVSDYGSHYSNQILRLYVHIDNHKNHCRGTTRRQIYQNMLHYDCLIMYMRGPHPHRNTLYNAHEEQPLRRTALSRASVILYSFFSLSHLSFLLYNYLIRLSAYSISPGVVSLIFSYVLSTSLASTSAYILATMVSSVTDMPAEMRRSSSSRRRL